MPRPGRKKGRTIWKFMRITAYRDALSNEEGESCVSERAPKMKFPGCEAGGAESGLEQQLRILAKTATQFMGKRPGVLAQLLGRSLKRPADFIESDHLSE
jgi:hypothetical protein